jgi:hypothetical protein
MFSYVAKELPDTARRERGAVLRACTLNYHVPTMQITNRMN